jgi:iron(III) transport system permease protein
VGLLFEQLPRQRTKFRIVPAGLTTMPIQIFQQLESGYVGPASAYSAILIVSIFLPLVVAMRVFKINLFGVGT